MCKQNPEITNLNDYMGYKIVKRKTYYMVGYSIAYEASKGNLRDKNESYIFLTAKSLKDIKAKIRENENPKIRDRRIETEKKGIFSNTFYYINSYWNNDGQHIALYHDSFGNRLEENLENKTYKINGKVAEHNVEAEWFELVE